jgi:hypothetical protein
MRKELKLKNYQRRIKIKNSEDKIKKEHSGVPLWRGIKGEGKYRIKYSEWKGKK